MNFYIENFNIEQLYKENEYINNTYFSSLVKIQAKKKDKSGTESIATLNNIHYTMYESYSEGIDVILIPSDFTSFKNDFNDMIIYNGNRNGLNFSILRKNNNIVELITYKFTTNENGYAVGNYRYSYFDDCKNQLQEVFNKQNKPITTFFKGISYYSLFNESYDFNRIKRNSNETMINRVRGENIVDAYLSFDNHFKPLNDNESPIMEILENLEKIKKKIS